MYKLWYSLYGPVKGSWQPCTRNNADQSDAK